MMGELVGLMVGDPDVGCLNRPVRDRRAWIKSHKSAPVLQDFIAFIVAASSPQSVVPSEARRGATERRAQARCLGPWKTELRAGGRRGGQEVACASPWGAVTRSPGHRGSVRYHEAEVAIQVLAQGPENHPILNVPHKKTMALARFKHKARSNRCSQTAAPSTVLSSSCWAMSTFCHISPTEEATKYSSYCS